MIEQMPSHGGHLLLLVTVRKGRTEFPIKIYPVFLGSRRLVDRRIAVCRLGAATDPCSAVAACTNEGYW